MAKSEIELTETEWIIIKAVWQGEPCTAPDVQRTLENQTSWTYSTVRTLMDRMVAKGLLKCEKRRNLTSYSSVVTPAEAQRGELLYALKHAFNGALTPLVQCLLDTNDISHEELSQIKQIINAHEQGTGAGCRTAGKPGKRGSR